MHLLQSNSMQIAHRAGIFFILGRENDAQGLQGLNAHSLPPPPPPSSFLPVDTEISSTWLLVMEEANLLINQCPPS